MSANSRDDGRDFPLKWIKDQLRAFLAVEPPAGLREKLRAGIPRAAGVEPRAGGARLWSGTMSWAGLAAAIVMICAVVWLLPSARPARPVTDINSAAGPTFAADHNSIRPPDINGCDSNGLY
jgi:hypothetical protein